MSNDIRYNSMYVYILCCVAALGGLMFGYSTGVITGVVVPIQKFYSLNPTETGWAVSSVIVGCIFGALAGGKIADRWGRKTALLIMAAIFIVSALGSGLAESFTAFSVSRILCGFAVGMAGTASPMYMSELSPAAIRGKALGIYNISIVLGQVIVFIVNFMIGKAMTETLLVEHGWRTMLLTQLVPSIAMLVITLFLPESPAWCARNNKGEKRSLQVLARVYPGYSASEVRGVFDTMRSQKTEPGEAKNLSLRASPVLKYILIVGCCIAVLQQFTGVNVMNYYAPLVLQSSGSGPNTVMFQTIFIAVCNGVGSVIGMILFDRHGRLPIMKIGTIGSIIGLLIASYGLYNHDTGYITIFGMLFFMLLFAASWSVGCWVLISEIFPERIKGIGMGLAVSLMWIANFLISQFFPVINENAFLQAQFGGAFSMWIFVVFNLVCYIFIARYVPETKGVSLEDIEHIATLKLQQLRGKHATTAELK
ncbi:SP family xylose:H+ symportor-like MFS transporter [Gibbsiella quercinecans]|uniref:MFS transporter n=1 Tax=Gibbsiella quercinecans TaxID=929813 RepID=A0A250B8G6_9GAMM|nr:sugar porter family MFS transporter [Gibbsiella quercinecans]ATA22538.1 MFS transporter [Gibbsiella quercinecans]RLM07435.1 MFS transporter [Gibbsiella quercinecans]RLM13569.1 MFS transporter [Gibbsiella quercinecans]TCT88533.1 SP family xylose:H+ symportor-like MFS transporter [Gibbsiella quercinecans]